MGVALALFLVVCLVAVVWAMWPQMPTQTGLIQNEPEPPVVRINLEDTTISPHAHVEHILQVLQGDWDEARRYLQQHAYGMVGPDATVKGKAQFTELMKAFAQHDPGYRQIMDRILPVLDEKPGMRQADLTRGLGERDLEMARYALYFGEQIGEVVRVQAGNSYSLYLPSQPKPSVAKPKAR